MRLLRWYLSASVLLLLFISQPFTGFAAQAAALSCCKPDEQQIEEFVNRYYQLKLTGNADLLTEFGCSEVEIRSALTEVACGLQAYHRLEVYSYPSSQNSWLVIAVCDSEFEDVDVLLPGAVSMCVVKDESGRFMLLPWQIIDEVSSQIFETNTQILLTNSEILKRMDSINTAYYKLLQNNAQVQNLTSKMNETYDNINLNDWKEPALDSKILYTVCAGDCLWDIADSYLDSGQQLWLKPDKY